MANQHFFKPLLPGFHSHLKIPVAFFSKHIEGRNEHKNMAKLRSDTSEITWKVKIEEGGMRLTDGWKEFALAHDLRVGDIVIFRQEKDIAFHVTIFGPSCCEIQYGSCLDDENKLVMIQSKKNVKNTKREAESCTLDPSCYVANVTPSSLRYDMLNLRKSFVRENGLETRCGEIVLINEKGTSWKLNLKRKSSCGTMYITRGWRRFCRVNGLRAGSFFTFKLIQRGGTLVLRMPPSSTESLSTESNGDKEKSFKKTRSIWKASSSPSQNLFVTLTLKPYDVKKSRLYLPVHFTRKHGINEETKMTMLDKYGVKWSTNLRSEKRSDGIRLVGGWKGFFKANCVKIGESIRLKLIWEGNTSCVLKFCSKVKQETR